MHATGHVSHGLAVLAAISQGSVGCTADPAPFSSDPLAKQGLEFSKSCHTHK